MQIHVTLYGTLRVVAGKQAIVLSFNEPTITIAQLLNVLATNRPLIRPYLLNETEESLHPKIRLLLNGTDSTSTVTLKTQLHDNDRIMFLAPLARA